MDLSSQEEEIPMPISSSYAGPPAVHGHGRMIHRDQPIPQNHVISSTSSPQLIPSSNGPISMTTSTPTPDQDEHFNPSYNKKVVQASIRYRECLKNHAAAMGGNATDGCGEFMPSGEEGTLEALKCSACNCHRNFHRKEVEGDHHLHHPNSCDCNTDYHLYHHPHLNKMGRKVVLGPHVNHKVMLGNSEALGYPTAAAAINISSRPSAPVPNQMIMPYNLAVPSDQSDEQEGGSGHQGFNVAIRGGPQYHHHQMMVKKRFRTKFTPEQKEKMLSFAQKVGWRIQKEEESVVQQFCQEIGVKRRVLKVWMHNNKHNLAKKNSSSNNNSDHHHHHQAIL